MTRSVLPVAVVVVAAAVFAPAAARAATVSETQAGTGLTQTYRADPGEANDLTVDRDPSSSLDNVFTDPGAYLVAGRGCSGTSAEVKCAVHGVRLINVLLGDLGDRARVEAYGPAATVSGGAGDDNLFADSFGNSTTVDG